MNRIEVLMHCKTGQGTFIAVFEEQTPQKWYANEAKIIQKPKSGLWQKLRSAFEVPPTQSAPPKTTEHFTGTFYMGKMRCPYCGSESFVRCNKCGGMTCMPKGSKEFKCQECGVTGKITGSISKVSGNKSETNNSNNVKPTANNANSTKFTKPTGGANNVKPPKAPWQQG